MAAALSPAHFFWLLLVLCLAGFALLYATVRDAGCGARRRALRRRIAALGAPAAEADEAAIEATIEAMREAMSHARQLLRQPPRQRAAPVPWFLFLGDAAANVPGLLAAAHAERLAASGSEPFGGPYWRWWLTGSMTAIELHPSAVSDVAAAPHARTLWLQALLALAERRDRIPINGLVVCVAASELLQPGGAGMKPLATRMRRLLDEAADTLRLQLPVYLVVTGLEQLAGYATLRGALPPEVLAQAIGHRLVGPAAHGEAAAERLDALFDPMARQLHALRMALLCEQPGASGRLAIHDFIEALRALQPALREVAEALFESHGRGSRGPRWRGLYLTAAASGAAGGAFVNDLFERFLPADQPLARPGRPPNASAARS
ncbi:type VI secretion system protein [Variovorax paradoxus]|uniref:type VI secretion system protein n=1 Tax=Variovorax paradoxus TaxID=34073 RepID=UPI00278AB4A3|nr:type VI secretion system protein [Variovorax paradoxus]MDQ0589001.1 type VI protein secretion system component VasK [Variovorax paradoxus]